MPSILFLGATGYIGSAVFNAFINAHPAYNYVALVRTPSHSSHIRAVNTVIGTLENHELLSKLAREADVVVNVARADDRGMVGALIEGLRRRKEEDGKVSAFIHTCGGDAFEGKDAWDDMDGECVSALLSPPVEQAILHAEEQGILHAYVIAPTLVYGLNPYEKPSPFYLQIIRELLSIPHAQTSSVPFPSLTRSAVEQDPDRVMGMVHVEDLATLYLIVLNKIRRAQTGKAPASEDASSRTYIVSVHERTCALLYHDVHKALVKRGLPTTCTFPQREDDKPAEPRFLAHRASSELDWEPTKPEWQHDMDWDINRALEVLKVNQPSRAA